jgi:hypothetical protein
MCRGIVKRDYQKYLVNICGQNMDLLGEVYRSSDNIIGTIQHFCYDALHRGTGINFKQHPISNSNWIGTFDAFDA